MTLSAGYHDSPLGPLLIQACSQGITQITIQPGTARTTQALADTPAPLCAILDAARRQLDGYFAGTLRRFDLPLHPAGTAFQQAVWRALLEIPHGQTVGYAQIAQRLGKPGAARAVGNANRLNPIGIVIPCHRVVGASGALVGYAAGLDAKRWLLRHEGAALPGLHTAKPGASHTDDDAPLFAPHHRA